MVEAFVCPNDQIKGHIIAHGNQGHQGPTLEPGLVEETCSRALGGRAHKDYVGLPSCRPYELGAMWDRQCPLSLDQF